MLVRRLSVVMLLLMVAISVSVVAAQSPVEIEWYVGLGAGGQPAQVAAQEAVVAAFNEANSDIQIKLTIVDNNVAYDTLGTLIASGNAPDLVGPVGTDGSNAFSGNFLDLQPLVDSMGYDLSQFPEAAVDSFRTNEGLIGIPFATFPSFIYFNRDLFDEAGAPYPPQEFGATYTDWNGEERTWDFETFRDLAMYLTVDVNGADATMEEFDSSNIVQWGYVSQWNETRGHGNIFGNGILVDSEGNAQIPDAWVDGWTWYYNGIWQDSFIPNASQSGSDLLANGNPFSSGNVAMAHTHLWYTCCVDSNLVPNWDIAVVPSNGDSTVAKLHGDTFRVLSSTEHPEEAFTVLAYLLGDASDELLQVYGGMPAREADQPAFFATLDERFTQGVNWDVAVASLAYADSPSHEANLPNYSVARDRIGAFQTLYEGTAGLDLPAEIERLRSDLQAIYSAADPEEAAALLEQMIPQTEEESE